MNFKDLIEKTIKDETKTKTKYDILLEQKSNITIMKDNDLTLEKQVNLIIQSEDIAIEKLSIPEYSKILKRIFKQQISTSKKQKTVTQEIETPKVRKSVTESLSQDINIAELAGED